MSKMTLYGICFGLLILTCSCLQADLWHITYPTGR